MLDYEQAKNWYANSQRDPYLGHRLSTYVYMRWDPKEDCFVVNEVNPLWVTVKDPIPGVPDHEVGVKQPKSTWTLAPFAKIFSDYVEITRAARSKYLCDLFGVEHCARKSIKFSGRTWFHKKKNYQGDVPIKIVNGGSLHFVNEPKVRTFDKDKQKELNALITKVRGYVAVRTKLGAFKNLTPKEVRQFVERAIPKGEHDHLYQWRVKGNPKQVIKLLKDVDPENFQSFYPMLWLADVGYPAHGSTNYGEKDWIRMFNSLIASVKEDVRKKLGVVSYV